MVIQIDNKAYWHEHVSKYLTSSLSQKSYCAQHDLALKTFVKWRYTFRNDFPVIKHRSHKVANTNNTKKSSNQFIEVKLSPEPDKTFNKGASLKLFLNEKTYFELPDNISEQLLLVLLRAIRMS